jgi:hypothetical protein
MCLPETTKCEEVSAAGLVNQLIVDWKVSLPGVPNWWMTAFWGFDGKGLS